MLNIYSKLKPKTQLETLLNLRHKPNYIQIHLKLDFAKEQPMAQLVLIDINAFRQVLIRLNINVQDNAITASLQLLYVLLQIVVISHKEPNITILCFKIRY